MVNSERERERLEGVEIVWRGWEMNVEITRIRNIGDRVRVIRERRGYQKMR